MLGVDRLVGWMRSLGRGPVKPLTIDLRSPDNIVSHVEDQCVSKRTKTNESEIEVIEATLDTAVCDGKHRKHPEHQLYDDALIAQYCQIRKNNNDRSYPEGLGIAGDKRAGFLLAVNKSQMVTIEIKGEPVKVPKVLGGFRLNEMAATGDSATAKEYYDKEIQAAELQFGKDSPEFRAAEIQAAEKLVVQADKVEAAQLQNVLPGIDRTKYTALNVDGATFDRDAGRILAKAVPKLLEGMVQLADRRHYDVVSFVPATKDMLDQRIIKNHTGHAGLKARKIPIADYDTAVRKGKEKRILCVVIDPKLRYLIPDGFISELPKKANIRPYR